MKKLYSGLEVAKEINVAPKTVVKWARKNRIRVYAIVGKTFAFERSAIDEIKNELKTQERPSVKNIRQ